MIFDVKYSGLGDFVILASFVLWFKTDKDKEEKNIQ